MCPVSFVNHVPGLYSVDWIHKKAGKSMDHPNGEMNTMLKVLIANDESLEIKIMLTMLMKKNCVI